jgi:hypothetical protein
MILFKSQITNPKYQTNPNDQNSKSQTVGLSLSVEISNGRCFGHWIFEFEIYLKFGACDLEF